MDVRKCIVPSWHWGTLNSRRAASPLVRLVEGEENWESPHHPQGVLPQKWGEIEPNRCRIRIRRKHVFGDENKDVQLSYEDDLWQTMYSTMDRVTAEIRGKFLQFPNLAQKCVFLKPEVILSMDELNLDQVPQDINKEEFQLESVRLQASVAATNLGCKK
ncbi:uncharacterized protein TNCV_4311401 [Trichonephila clavipes]|nr:uncharacterized protein TNCV_4311401 [Trichonephila clavipes]